MPQFSNEVKTMFKRFSGRKQRRNVYRRRRRRRRRRRKE
jgi:hypothetical protein